MMSARVRIEGYTVGYPEFLSVSSQYSNFTYDVSILCIIDAIIDIPLLL